MTGECPRCSYDAGAKVLASWSFVVELPAPNLNDRASNGRNGHAYRRARDGWTYALKAIAPADSRRALGKRRVTITRVFGRGCREWDHDNLVGGCKMVVDAMVRAGVLLGDSGRWLQATYQQERGKAACVRFVVEELG